MANETKKIDWKKVWSFIKSKVFLALLIIGLIAFNVIQWSTIKELKRQQNISDINIIALNDSLKYEKLKNGDLQVSISSFVASEKELKELNKKLYDEVKAQKGRVISLTDAIVQLRQDSATLKKYLVEKDKVIEKLLQPDENTYLAPWTLTYKYDSVNYDIFSGNTYIGIGKKDPLELLHLDTELTSRLTQIELIWGHKVENNQYRVFAQSAYPGFTVAQMQGVLIDPNTNPDIQKLLKKKHWFQGFSVGLGTSMGFNITTGKYGMVMGPTFVFQIYDF